MEVIDCVLAIFLFELTRAFRSSVNGQNTIYSKDQFVFKILHFFTTLRLAKTKQEVLKNGQDCTELSSSKARRLMRKRNRAIEEDSAEDLEESTDEAEEELTALIESI